MITSVFEGDLIELFKKGKFNAIVHGCNCYHSMDGGIAKVIAEEFPEAREADKETYFGELKLGTFSQALIERAGKVLGLVINMYTQGQPGHANHDVLEASIKQGFRTLNHVSKILAFDPDGKFLDRRPVIGVPLIGAGIAGGSWRRHAEIITSVTPDVDIVVVTLPDASTKTLWPKISSQRKFNQGEDHV